MQGVCFLLPLLLALVAVASALAEAPRAGMSGYFAPSDNTVDDATISWTSFPNGASNMNHRPWVQPRVPTGPIVIPASSSIGPQYSNVLLPQPILPFASNFVSMPMRDGRATPNSHFADYTNHLAPPIFLETDARVTSSAAARTKAKEEAIRAAVAAATKKAAARAAAAAASKADAAAAVPAQQTLRVSRSEVSRGGATAVTETMVELW